MKYVKLKKTIRKLHPSNMAMIGVRSTYLNPEERSERIDPGLSSSGARSSTLIRIITLALQT
jgi:hypothetical protein